MNQFSPDRLVSQDDWSDLSQFKSPPTIDIERLHIHRLARLRACVEETGAAMCLLVNPVSLRYAVDYRAYALFQSHIPTAYLFVPVDGPVVIHGAIDTAPMADESREARPISYFDGATELESNAKELARDVVNYLKEIGTDNRRVAVEYVNPSITQALDPTGGADLGAMVPPPGQVTAAG